MKIQFFTLLQIILEHDLLFLPFFLPFFSFLPSFLPFFQVKLTLGYGIQGWQRRHVDQIEGNQAAFQCSKGITSFGIEIFWSWYPGLTNGRIWLLHSTAWFAELCNESHSEYSESLCCPWHMLAPSNFPVGICPTTKKGMSWTKSRYPYLSLLPSIYWEKQAISGSKSPHLL